MKIEITREDVKTVLARLRQEANFCEKPNQQLRDKIEKWDNILRSFNDVQGNEQLQDKLDRQHDQKVEEIALHQGNSSNIIRH